MRAWITTERVSADSVLQYVGSDSDGAVCVFLGVVRNHNDGRPVRAVSYTAYAEMAESVLNEIAREAAARAHSDQIAVVHRTGELSVGATSVAIAVASPHREQAFDACRYMIEEIKKRVPVWKEERYADGESAWLDGVQPEPRSAPQPEAQHG